jgi:ubiquinone biosynthesis protein
VKRPFVEEKFKSDILIMEDFARRIKRHINIDFIDPLDVVEEFKKYNRKELDFNHEKSSINRFRKNFANNKNVHIPFVYDKYSGKDIIVMELLQGQTILELPRLSQKDKSIIVRNVFSATFKQLFEDGFFHADLHAGNIIISKNNAIGLIDFGITGYIDDELKIKLTNLFIALVEGDLDKTTDSLLDLNIGQEYPDKAVLKEGIYYTLADYYGSSIECMNFSEIFYNAIDTAMKSKVKMPAQLVLFGKSIISMEGFCRMIDPEYNFIRESRPYAKRLLIRQLAPSKLAKGGISAAISFKNMMLNIPSYIKEFSNQMRLIEKSAVELDIQFSQFQKTLVRMTKALIFGIILASLIVSSALLIDAEPKIFNMSVISLIGYVVSVVLAVNMVWLFRDR